MTTSSKFSHEQVIRKANSELAVLDKDEAAALQTIGTIDAEIATIQARIQARAVEFSTLHETASSRQAQFETVVTQDRLAVGTLQEGSLSSQVKAAEREKDKAAKALAAMEARIQKEEGNDHIKLQALSAERASCTRRLVDSATQRATLEQAKAAAHAAMGEDEYQDIVFQLETLYKQLEARQKAVRQAEAELDEFAYEALSRLADWPAHLERVKARLPYHDRVTRILEAASVLYALLLMEGETPEVDTDLLRAAAGPFTGHMVDLLALQERDLWLVAAGRIAEARTIRESRTKFTQLLEMHRERRRQQRER